MHQKKGSANPWPKLAQPGKNLRVYDGKRASKDFGTIKRAKQKQKEAKILMFWSLRGSNP